ncbi:hypothetical protein [Bacteroides sp.]
MKRFYYLAAASLLSAFVATAQAQDVLADFEEPELDMLDMTGYNNDANGSLAVVANPVTDGINTTTQCLLNNRKLVDWSNSYGKLYSSFLDSREVTDENRYLHIMVYAEESVGSMLYIRTGETDDIWAYDGDHGGTEIRFNFTAGKWADVVVDLKGKVESVYGFYLLSQDWSVPQKERNFYYDEIVMNDDPLPRGLNAIAKAGVAADFEESGSIPTFEDTGSGCASINIVDNEDNEGVNQSAKALMIEAVAQEGAQFWAGANITFENTFMVTDANRYLHILMKTDLEQMEYDLFADGEQWMGNFVPQKDVWYDYVIDLMNTKKNLSGKLLTGFRAIVCADKPVNYGKKLYLDEIILNDSPMPRVYTPTGLAKEESTQVSAFAIENGICIKNAFGEVCVYDAVGKNVYRSICNGDATVNLPEGLYVVSSGDARVKVIVK